MSLEKELYQSSDVWAQPMQQGQRNLLRALLDFWPDEVESVLDVGCGDGKLTRVLAAEKTGAKFVGLDSSSEALSRMPLESVLGKATQLPFANGSFDLVMSTDALEHIPDTDELIAWREIFRVASTCVMVAVPFKEELLDATARCCECSAHYHVNWHQRSYDIEALVSRMADGWSVAGVVLSGEPWSAMLPPETAFRRTVLDEWSGWEMAVCPHCGAKGTKATAPSNLPKPLSSVLGDATYETLKSKRFARTHSEVLIVFRKDQKQLNAPPEGLSHSVQSACEIRFDMQQASPNLHPYPQVASYARGEDGRYRLQFPIYEGTQELYIQRKAHSEEEIYLQLEDAEGLLYEGCALSRGVEKASLRLNRPLSTTYYGVLGTCSADAPILSISLGRGPEILRVQAMQDVGYYRIEQSRWSLFVQAVGEVWIDAQALLKQPSTGQLSQAKSVVEALCHKLEEQEHYLSALGAFANEGEIDIAAFPDAAENLSWNSGKARVLMLCHDQQLDRRVVAQAKTLVDSGYSVHLLALSFTSETTHEVLPEGVRLTRIGLANIIPENPTYLSYLWRLRGLTKLLKLFTYHFPLGYRIYSLGHWFGSKANSIIYKLASLLRYRNRGIHDPLPFRSAFVSEGARIPSDLVQVHDLPALEAGVELAASWGVPLVYDAHELYPEQKSFSSAQRKICSEAESRLIKHADLVFAVNESIGEEMARRYGIAKPVTLLNAIDPPADFEPQADHDLLRQKLGLSAQRRILLFQGGFAPHRNLETLIEAMAHVRTQDVDLVMMGFGSFGELLKEKAARLKLLDRRIYFLPAVPQAELLQHSASADLGIIPYPHVDLNSYYCTPNKLFEFIQAGLPILANDSPELNRFVRSNGFGHSAVMKTPRDIARAIDDAFAVPDSDQWRSAILQKRGELAWCAQSRVYLDAMQHHLISSAKKTDMNVAREAIQ